MISIQEREVRVVIWTDVTAEHVAALEKEVASQYQRCGQRLVYVSVVPEDAPIPDSATRKAIADAIGRFQDQLEYTGQVFQGTGLKASIKRTAFAGILLLAMKGKWPVAASLDDLIARAGGDLRRVNQLRLIKKIAADKGFQV